MKLYELCDSGAFVYADEERLPNAVVSISGDYMTVWYATLSRADRYAGAEWVADQSGPWQHGLGDDEKGGGLYGADAAELVDAARSLLEAIADGSLYEEE